LQDAPSPPKTLKPVRKASGSTRMRGEWDVVDPPCVRACRVGHLHRPNYKSPSVPEQAVPQQRGQRDLSDAGSLRRIGGDPLLSLARREAGVRGRKKTRRISRELGAHFAQQDARRAAEVKASCANDRPAGDASQTKQQNETGPVYFVPRTQLPPTGQNAQCLTIIGYLSPSLSAGARAAPFTTFPAPAQTSPWSAERVRSTR